MRRLLFTALVAVSVAVPATASASFPGQNGDIAYAGYPPGAREPWVGIVEADGTNPRTIAFGGEAQWSPDGTRLAYTLSSDATGIGLVDADGSDQETLFPAEPGSPSHPSWFPDGETLGAMSATGGFVRIDIATKAITPVAEDTLFPLVAPNGQLVAFRRGGDLWIMNADGTGQRLLAAGGDQPDFAPDSSQVVFVRGGDLFVIDVAGTGERPLTTGAAVDSFPVWSPDGTLVAFNRGGEIWVTAPDGTGQRQLATIAGDELPSDWQRAAATPPASPLRCARVEATPDRLAPANGKFRTVTLDTSEAGGTGPLTVQILRVTSDEPVGSKPDARRLSDPASLLLRAERGNRGDGRVYEISFRVTDATGATCTGWEKVEVRRHRKRPAVEGATAYDAFGY